MALVGWWNRVYVVTRRKAVFIALMSLGVNRSVGTVASKDHLEVRIKRTLLLGVQ